MHREPSAPDAPLDACAVLDGTAAMAEEKQHIEQFNVDARPAPARWGLRFRSGCGLRCRDRRTVGRWCTCSTLPFPSLARTALRGKHSAESYAGAAGGGCGRPDFVIEQQGPQLSFKPAPTVVSLTKVDVGSVRWILGQVVKLLRAFRRFPYKLRRCECGRFEYRSGEWDIASFASFLCRRTIGPVSP